MDKITILPYPDFKLLEYVDPDKFDANNEALRAKIDEIVQFINDLSSIVSGVSGAEQIGSAPITGVTGTTVHAQISNVRTLIDQLVLGQIADDSITNAKMHSDVKVGSLATLTTTTKSSVVGAINEIVTALNDVAENIGNLSTLTTTEKTNIVGALNEINGNIGDLDNLLTSNKISIVAAINEVQTNAMPKDGGTFTGEVSMGRQNLNQPKLKDYSETVVTIGSATGTVSLNLANGNVFDVTLAGATTLTFNNPAPSGQACSFTLKINQGATPYAITYPASVKWDNDVIPDVANANKSYIIVFATINGGDRYYGRLAMGGLTT